MINQDSILKPHYQLLGMLLERHELKSALQEMAGPNTRQLAHDEQTVDSLAARLALLDRDILEHYDYVVHDYVSRGRTVRDLESFVGSDLVNELDAALQRSAQ